MKNPVYYFIILLVAASAIYGCTKTSLAPIPKTKLASSNALDTSKLHLYLNVSQPTTIVKRLDTITIIGIPVADTAATRINWIISDPADQYPMQTTKERYIVRFNKAGSYKFRALINGIDTISTIVKVTDTASATPPIIKDTIPTPPPTFTSIPFTGDQITLIPNLYKSADTSYIYFVAQTTKTYSCANSKIYSSYSDANNKFSLDFISVVQPNGTGCLIGPSTLSQGIYYYQNYQNPYMVNGTYPLTVTLNGVTYTGNIIVSATAVTFDWNYTSGVVFSTKQISR
jgi:hypothetical protein